MDTKLLIKELKFKAIKSSGAGGQHVNKVSSKIVLLFDLMISKSLTVNEKQLLLNSLSNKLSNEHILILSCDESRSQHKNKELVIQRFIELIKQGLAVKKTRIPTKIPKAVIKKRLDAKKIQSAKKTNRKKPTID